MIRPACTREEYDLVGIGFGPANLALAAALHDRGLHGRRLASQSGAPFDAVFLEGRSGFTWHDGMLLPDARMQISFLKDLVTACNPTSSFSFLSYLHDRGRLRAFMNQRSFFPSRRDFHAYFCWAASRLAERVCYDRRVQAVEPIDDGGAVTRLRVISRDGAGRAHTVVARGVVIATGGTPRIPPVFAALGQRSWLFHTASYLPGVTALPRPPRRIAVVGGGQSAGEAFLDLQARFPSACIDLVLRGFALRVADDSPFVNEIFEPGTVDLLYCQSEARRDRFLAEFRHTNYAAVDEALLRRISDLLYQQQVTGGTALRVCARRRIVDAVAGPEGCTVTLHDEWTRQTERLDYDLVVLATGYDRDTASAMLAPLARWLPEIKVNRDYRLDVLPGLEAPLFMQGGGERSHGIGDTLLSLLPERAEAILAAFLPSGIAAGGPLPLPATSSVHSSE